MHRTTRGQSGLDKLLVFVIVAVIIVAALPTVLGVAGIDVRQTATSNTTPTLTLEPASLQVLNASVERTNKTAQTVGIVRVTVTKVGSAASVDLSKATVTWAGKEVYFLTPSGVERSDSDGTFGVRVQQINDDTGLVLGDTGDRATLTFDIGDDDVAGIGQFGEPLAEGETVDLVLATADGRTTSVTVRVPESLDGRTVVGV